MAATDQCDPAGNPPDVQQLSTPKPEEPKEALDQATIQRLLAVRFYDEVIPISLEMTGTWIRTTILRSIH